MRARRAGSHWDRPAVRAVSAAALAAALAACGSTTVTPGASDGPAPTGLSAAPGKAGAGPQTATTQVVDGMRKFAIDFHGIAAVPGTNTVFSPLSVAHAFAMLRAGALGETAEQLEATFGLPPDVHAAMAQLSGDLVTTRTPPPVKKSPPGKRGGDLDHVPEAPVLTIANGMFVLPNYPLLPEFRRTVTADYRGEVSEVDFSDTATAARVINAWIDKHTAGRIPDMVTPEDVPPDAAIALANAVYFKGSWAERLYDGGEMNFDVAGSPVSVPAMGARDTRGYAAGEGWQAIELPYADSSLAMRIIVPTGTRTPADLLTPQVLDAAGKTEQRLVDLRMPSWDFETRLDLKKLLPSLGLTLPFGPQADLSAISGEGLYIKKALHAANITVDQLGTEASAATIMFAVPVSGGGPVPVAVNVDRPFVFEILDTKTGAPLFLGSVEDPRKK